MSKNALKKYRKVSNHVSEEFDDFFRKKIESRDDAEDLLLLYKKFLDTKEGHVHDRVVHVYIAGKLFGLNPDKNMGEFLRLMVPVELTIWSNYAINWVTDQKNNISGTKKEENLDIVSSQYLLTEVLYFLPDRMLRRYLEVYRWIMKSYLMVETTLTIENFETLRSENAYWKAYGRHHSIAGVGSLYAYAFEVVKDYFEVDIDEGQFQKARKVLLEYGRCLQVNNDLSEFIITDKDITTTEKRPDDYFIDIRTNRLSYGVWKLLKETEDANPELFKQIKSAAKTGEYEQGFFEDVTSYLKQSDILSDAWDFLKYERRRLEKEVDKLPFEGEGKELWKMSLLTIENNKFLRQLKANYGITE